MARSLPEEYGLGSSSGLPRGQTETISVGSLREVEGRSAKDSIQPSRISIGDPFERGLAERPPEGMDERERRQDR